MAVKKTKRMKEDEKLSNFLQFIAILAIAAIILNYLTATHRDMVFEKRAIGSQVNFFLNLIGTNSSFYEQVVRINNYPEKNNAVMQLSRYLDEKKMIGDQVELRAKHIHPDDEKIVREFVEAEQAKGNPIYYSPSYVITTGEFGETQVEIIPECVGWIGLFAIAALIIATPGIAPRKKLNALLIALPIMYLVNLLRLTTTIYIGTKAGEAALYFTHDILWRIILIGTALIIWLAWYSKNKPK